jgi:uncharacterized protein
MTRRLVPLVASLALLASVAAAAQPGYPAANGMVVNDYANVLEPAHEDSIQALVGAIRRVREVDVRVVTIQRVADYRTGAGSVEAFATGLFNAWAVGGTPRNDGALLLVSVGDRRAKIELGDGAPASLDAATQDIFDVAMVPRFRQGDYGGGVVAGVEGLLQAYARAYPAETASPSADAGAPAPVYDPAAPAAAPVPAERERPGAGWGGLAILAALVGGGALGIGGVARMARRRRQCPHCATEMALVDEAADDLYLDTGQKAEEALKSVDYRVWKCGSCGHHEIRPSKAWFSGKKECPQCRYRTVSVTKRTLERPTYTSTGSELVTSDCAHCSHHTEVRVTLPRRTPPSSSSGGGGSRRSSSSGSSSGRSYTSGGSSGGSSFRGGGSSSGRGGGGGW